MPILVVRLHGDMFRLRFLLIAFLVLIALNFVLCESFKWVLRREIISPLLARAANPNPFVQEKLVRHVVADMHAAALIAEVACLALGFGLAQVGGLVVSFVAGQRLSDKQVRDLCIGVLCIPVGIFSATLFILGVLSV